MTLNLNDLISLKDAVYLTGLPYKKLQRMARSGKLEAEKVSRDWITTRQALKDINLFKV